MISRKITQAELQSLLHPTEESRFDLALLVTFPVISIGLLVILSTVAFVLIYVVLIIGVVWLSLQITKAKLTANAVKVTSTSFPEIYAILQEVRDILDYDKPVDVYIIEEGTVNAALAKFFRTKFIILNSELVEDMIQHDSLLQMKWVIARFIGALKVKHDKLTLFRIIIDSLEKLQIFNVFLLPYERAIQYSGDQIGLAVCGDLHQSMFAFQKFMVGNTLSKHVSMQGVMQQKKEMGLFATIARLFSTHPHVVDRYVNLLHFAENRYPDTYAKFVQMHADPKHTSHLATSEKLFTAPTP
jgi:Zn-dependent protease with chaperone function